MTLTPTHPAAPEQRPPVDPVLLEVDAGVMIQGHYGPREYCAPCAKTSKEPGARRTISLYEVLTSYRKYTCCHCRKPLWNPANGAQP